MTTRKGTTSLGSSLQEKCGKSMPVLAFWERLMLIKEGTCPFAYLWSFTSRLSGFGWPCLRIESYMPVCSAFLSVLQISLILCLLSRSAQ